MKKSEFNCCVGIDASKKSLDLAFICLNNLNACEQICVTNNKSGFKKITLWLQGLGVKFEQVLFCMEFTGIYNRPVQKYLDTQGAFLWMEMPVRIIRSIGLQRGKSDKIDAKRIALYAARHQEDRIKWILPSKTKDAIEDLIALRNRLIIAKNMLQVPIKELEAMDEKGRSANIKNHSKKSIKSLELEIEKTEEDIRTLIKSEPAIDKNINLMKSIPGVGTWTALEVICATDNFRRLNNAKQLSCYCGCAPFEHTSGTSVRGRSRVSHMAQKNLKSLLTLGAASIIRSKNELSKYYFRKVAEGKNKMSVINAVRNKIIHRIVVVVKRQTPYVEFAQANC